MEDTVTQVAYNDSGLPAAEHARIVRLLTSYAAIAFVYLLLSTPLYLVILGNLVLGLIYLVLTIFAGSLLLHLGRTRRTRLASFGICTIAAAVVSILALTGSAASSGTYSVFGGTIFMFFMPYRRHYVITIIGMYVFFVVIFGLALAHLVTLPYASSNFAFFLFSLGMDNILLLLYDKEKSLVDQKLKASLHEISILAQRLRGEKETVEEKVRVRTTQYRAEHAKLAASIDSLQQGFLLVNADTVTTYALDPHPPLGGCFCIGRNVLCKNQNVRKIFTASFWSLPKPTSPLLAWKMASREATLHWLTTA